MEENIIKIHRERSAYFFKQMVNQSIIDSMNLIFGVIKKAAESRKYSVNIQTELDDGQTKMLENLDFSVSEFDESDDEYREGYRYEISWDQAYEFEEENN
jgi:hypothetical protein